MGFNIGVLGSFDFKNTPEFKGSKDFDCAKIYRLDVEKDIVSQLQDSSVELLIISLQEKNKLINAVSEIRASADFYLLPILSVDESYEIYVDGLYSNEEELKSIYDKLETKKKSLVNIDTKRLAKDWQTRFLTYLYTRKGLKNLTASVNVDNSSLYGYPLIEVFCDDDKYNYLFWLTELQQSNLLKAKKLVKSYFSCRKCDSARILFSECCPECKSENITLSDFIHCYSCGNIAPQINFIKNEQFVCNQCNTKLRHIGQDYDRPLESYMCNDCGENFIESNVSAACIDCGDICQTEQLKKTKIYNYELSEKAEHYIRNNIEYAMSVFDNINYAAPDFFYSMIEWCSKIQKRNEAYEFSLLKIEVSDTISIQDINAVAKKLREILRTTDILTRTTEEMIWIWLPNTPLKGAEVVVKKFKELKLSDGVNIDNIISSNIFFSKDLDIIQNAKLKLIEIAGWE
jgi:predicted Zn-ribbon and HTH transcriptional regulator